MNAVALARRAASPVAAVVVVVVLAAAPLLGATSYVVVTATSVLAYALVAMSISFIGGHAGLLTLAHAAYAGVGSYAVALTARHVTGDGLVQLLIAVLAGAGIAAISGWIVVRATKTFFLMLTLAVGELLHVLALQWRDLTKGSDGLLAGGPFRLAGSGPVVLLLAVIIGGLDSMWGACLGAAAVALTTNVLSQDLGGHGPLVLGVAFVIAVYALPRGIAGLLGVRRSAAASSTVDGENDAVPTTLTRDGLVAP